MASRRPSLIPLRISLPGPYLDDLLTRQERDDGVLTGDQKTAEVNGIREAGLLCGNDDDLRHR